VAPCTTTDCESAAGVDCLLNGALIKKDEWDSFKAICAQSRAVRRAFAAGMPPVGDGGFRSALVFVATHAPLTDKRGAPADPHSNAQSYLAKESQT